MSPSIKFKELLYLATVRIPTMIYGRYIAKNLIKVHWGRGLCNFGDCLQPATLRHYGLTPVYVSSMEKSDIIMAGSILQWLQPEYSGIILGTGGDKKIYSFPNARIIGVRGEKTRECLPPPISNCILGDCGLLVKFIYPQPILKKFKVGIVPHFTDLRNKVIRKIADRLNDKVTIISPLDRPDKVVNKIKECDCILSSSLHGLIIADAFGIPNRRWVDRETMPDIEFYDYKFKDYYSSIGIEEEPIQLTGNEDLQGLVELTSFKPQDRIESLILGLDSAMKEITKEFRNRN